MAGRLVSHGAIPIFNGNDRQGKPKAMRKIASSSRIRAAWRIVGLFLVALAAGWVLAASAYDLIASTVEPEHPPARPTLHAYKAFEAHVKGPGQAMRDFAIATDTDCTALPTTLFLEACSLAINADPAIIGGAAFGQLNFKDTPSFTALIWRARLDRDPSVCDRGGLENPRLSVCHRAADASSYRETDQGLELTLSAQ